MSRSGMRWCVGVVAAVAASGLVARPAHAVKPFKEVFEAKYVKADGKAPEEVALAKAVASAKCGVCHAGESKKQRNAYGVELAKLLSKDTDKENKQKILDSLEKVAKLHSDPKDSKSPTFGDLIKQGKLPATK